MSNHSRRLTYVLGAGLLVCSQYNLAQAAPATSPTTTSKSTAKASPKAATQTTASNTGTTFVNSAGAYQAFPLLPRATVWGGSGDITYGRCTTHRA